MIHWATNPAKLKQYIMLLGDAAVVVLAFAIGLAVRAALINESFIALARRFDFLGLAAVTLLLQLIVFFVFNLYDLNVQFRRGRGLVTAAFATLVTVGISAALFFFAGRFIIGRTVLLLYVPVVTLGAVLWRLFFFNRLLLVERKRKLALVGIDESIENLLAGLAWFPVKNFHPVAVLCENATAAQSHLGELPVRACTAETLPEIVEEADIDTLVYSVTTPLSDELLDTVLDMRLQGLEVYDLPTFCSKLTGKIPVYAVDTRWVLQAIGKYNHRSAVIKNARRVTELVLGLFIATVTAPLFLLISLAIKLDSRGPILFRQERLGLNRKPFVTYKFRTMVQDAEANTGPVWTVAQDPRVTRVGHILRKTGLDELPQLINIFRGEMTYVGFRPIRRHFADKLAAQIPFYQLRFTIRPGVTGWPQVHHNYAGSVEGQFEKFEYELFYLQNASPLLDAFIILKTVQKILFRGFSEVSPEESQRRAAELPRPATSID